MDAFTERMLDRARARQAKLDAMKDKSNDSSCPLRENNRNKVTASTSVDITKGANNRNTVTIETTVTMKRVPSKGSLKNRSFEKKVTEVVEEEGTTSFDEESEMEEEVEKKENMSPRRSSSQEARGNQPCEIRQNMKSQLKRLGQLYSDDEPNISSPIHRTEEHFNIDERCEAKSITKPTCDNMPSAKPARSARLAALAKTINQWEDDLSHPNIGPQEAQGFCRSESNKRLIYEYANQVEEEPANQPVMSSPKSTAGKKSPGKSSQNINRFGSPNQAGPTMGIKQLRSPRKNTTLTSGSVLDKAAQFEEATSPTKRTKDPAELSLSERLALFEKNKGSAILPKAPFASSVPIKHEIKRVEHHKPNMYDLRSGDPPKPTTSSSFTVQHPVKKLSKSQIAPTKTSSHHENEHPQHAVSKGLKSRLAMFEPTQMEQKDHMKDILMERQKEMQMLKNRWNRNKETNDTPQSYSPAPPPPPLPPSPQKYEPRRSGFFYESEEEEEVVQPKQSVPKIVEVTHSKLPEISYPGLRIKPVKVSPPKPGRLYPCLSDMDTESEVPESDDCHPGNDRDEYNEEEEEEQEEEEDSDESGSLGQKIKEVAERHSRSNLKRDWSSSEQSDTDVLNEIDDFLDEALGEDSTGSGDEATPPKRSMTSPRYGLPSHSFEYSQGDRTTDDEQSAHMDIDQKLPLLHTVSFYRKQQTLSMKPVTPSRQVQIDPSLYCTEQDSLNDTEDLEQELAMIDDKIEELQQEVIKHSIVIQQASQALNLCYSTIEFSGSTEQVEAEKHLLVATIKRQAAQHEIQRLKIECSLRPQGPNNKMLTERGSVTLSNITLPLKLDIIRSAARDEQCYYLVCLIRCGEKVVATNMMSTLPRSLRENNKLTFPNVITLDRLYSDFKITVEVYAMTARSKEVIPHDIKYHIGTTKKEASKLKLTPKKNKGESRLVMPVVQSPGGPNAVRTSAFNQIGYVIFSLREIQRTQFTLNKVAYTCVLEGSLHLKLDCEMSVDVEHRGFLTMFEDISGFGAWHRRWCLLKGDQLSYWKYPDDERKKIAIDTIELSACITDVIGPVSRDLCARPNTFLLETARPTRSNDVESLVLMRDGSRTINRHLLSADTKEERVQWCTQLNRSLALMRAWGKKLPTH